MIPKILHFIWIGKPMPEWVLKVVDQFRNLNLEYRVMVHGEEILFDIYRNAYNSSADLCTKSDLLRLSALRKYGGWYFDCDFWPVRPIRDIVGAYAIKDRPFITRQNWVQRKSLVFNNGVLALPACPAPVWSIIDSAIANVCLTQKIERVSFGPKMFTRIMEENKGAFTEGDWPWFYPSSSHPARVVVDKLINRKIKISDLTRLTPETHGQLPFVIHMFADGATDIFKDLSSSGLHAGIFCSNDLSKNSITHRTMRALAVGLPKIGVSVETVQGWAQLRQTPDMLFVWNGMKGGTRDMCEIAKSHGCVVFRSEHGFFNRHVYTQIDHEGILHWASWSNKLTGPAPAEGTQRLKEVWKFPIEGFKKRHSNRILVLGQLAGDSQMMESEIKVAKHVVQLVRDNLPKGMRAFFRPHPKSTDFHTRQALKYLPREPSGSLMEAVQKSKFAVMINSNAGNECLAWGCPVMAFGPALYLQARCALPCDPRNIGERLQEMIDGWQPDEAMVKNYLHWLACRQWSFDELKQARFLKPLVEAAQCPLAMR